MDPVNELEKSFIDFKNNDVRNNVEEDKEKIHLELMEEELIDEIFSGMAWNG
ncbi:MAG: hypothetical protein ACOY4D_08355 [Pseudomonadota bacterium]